MADIYAHPGRMIYFTPAELANIEANSKLLQPEASREIIRRQVKGRWPEPQSPRWFDNNAKE